ncbi:MAG: polynucleotide kinase-phosphatase [Alcanivoracaceae bacterium]|nr:polynucleotide kinase-phosphatase [Alcanivoracaceae bacterium]
MNRKIILPELSLIAMIGISSSGKSSFVKKHFLQYESVSSDQCRGIVSNDENNLKVTADAFEMLDYIVRKRLKRGLLTVLDATHVQPDSRKSILQAARDYHCLPVAIVLNPPMEVIEERHENREDREFSKRVLANQQRQLKRTIRFLKKEGFRYIYKLNSIEEIDNVEIIRQPMWTNKKNEEGPFDIIGDIHGCYDELHKLLLQLGYQITDAENQRYTIIAPENRKAVFVGDLIDRGPENIKVLKLVMDMVNQEAAICVPGNHENKLLKWLRGRKVQLKHGLEVTTEQIKKETDEFKIELEKFIDSLISHYVFDHGKLVVAHAGMKESYQGRGSGKVRSFALYGETSGETDEYGLPIRYNWARDYRGEALVVYGHTPVPEAEFFNNTICLDTGCVFGGKLTALKYPESELVSVAAAEVYYEPVKPLVPESNSSSNQQIDDEYLYLEDVTGKRFISSQLGGNIKIEANRSASALESMSRFCIHPKWINYLPPTMSPPASSNFEDFLEHPDQAFDYYKKQGVKQVICEEKHMGSRAIIQIGKDSEAIKTAFGITTGETGIVYTRNGRRFFKDRELEHEFISRFSTAITQSGLWEELDTDWLTLDCEIMPWSMKAMDLIKRQYAAVGCTSYASTLVLQKALEQAKQRGLDVDHLISSAETTLENSIQFKKAYQNYCWNVESLNDIKVAPFHIMASEGRTHTDKNHQWHMENITKISDQDNDILFKTEYFIVDLDDADSIDSVTKWWLQQTQNLAEGMVVKPLDFIAHGERGITQPAIKVRGQEYLRIIYGIDYTKPENLERLRKRSLGIKRRLAISEFKLGYESLHRFTQKMPLRQIHECAFGVLAMQSEPTDPRL